MATVSVNLTPTDVYLIVGMLAAGADPLTEPTKEMTEKYVKLGDMLIQTRALRVRVPEVETGLEKARAALNLGEQEPDHANH